MRAGVHVAPSKSVTVRGGRELDQGGRRRRGSSASTVKQYREHVDQHIVPFIGRVKLSDLTRQAVRKFEDRLRAEGRSPAMVRKIIGSLARSWPTPRSRGLPHAMPFAIFAATGGGGRSNTPRSGRRASSRSASTSRHPTRSRPSLQMPRAAGGRFLITAIFTGLRASELRGLRWKDVDLKANELHVRQRADRFNEIGKPKSAAGERMVPFGKFVANTLKEWKLACPKSDLDLVFPNGAGKVESLANIINRGLIPAQPRRGRKAKYTGMHALRHFYASWCINR